MQGFERRVRAIVAEALDDRDFRGGDASGIIALLHRHRHGIEFQKAEDALHDGLAVAVEFVLQQDQRVEPAGIMAQAAGIAAGPGIEPLEAPVLRHALRLDLQRLREGQEFRVAADILEIVGIGPVDRVALPATTLPR